MRKNTTFDYVCKQMGIGKRAKKHMKRPGMKKAAQAQWNAYSRPLFSEQEKYELCEKIRQREKNKMESKVKHDVLIIEVDNWVMPKEEIDMLSDNTMSTIRAALDNGNGAVIVQGMKVVGVAHADGSIELRNG